MSIAIVTTALRPDASFSTWLEYHLRRVKRLFIYLDDPSERPVFEALVNGKPVQLLDGSQIEPEMSKESRLILRQDVNTNNTIDLALQQNIVWLLHIDLDELLFEANAATRRWIETSTYGCVHFTNHEAVPIDGDCKPPFKECMWFRVNGGNKPFMAYGNGRCAVRLSETVRADGPHMFKGYNGDVLRPDAEESAILHYPTPSFDRWVAKYTHYGDFSDFWFGDRSRPNLVSFMTRSRDLVQQAQKTGDWSEARAFFSTWMLGSEVESADVRCYMPLRHAGLASEDGES